VWIAAASFAGAPRLPMCMYITCGDSVQQMVVERRLLDAAFLELREHRTDSVSSSTRSPIQHRLGVAHLLERDPRAKRQCGLHGHTADRDVEVTARHPTL